MPSERDLLRAMFAALLVHGAERFLGWTLKYSLTDQVAVRAPDGRHYLIAITEIPPSDPDAQALDETARFLSAPG